MGLNIKVTLFVSSFFLLSLLNIYSRFETHFPRALALCGSFWGNCELFPRSDRNAELRSGVDQVTAEQSFFLNASIYP